MTDHIDLPNTIGPPIPCGLDIMVGTDGKHYTINTAFGSPTTVRVGCRETSSIVKSFTSAQWRTDLGTLGFTLAGAYQFSPGMIIPAPGTPYFYVGGYQFIGFTGEIVFVRYRIDSPSSVVVDGGLHYMSDLATGPFTGYNWGCAVIGGKLYSLADTGSFSPDHLSVCLLQFPLSGTHEDLAPNSWAPFATDVTAQYDWGFFRTEDSRQYYNRAALIAHGATKVGILCYVGQTEIDSYVSHVTTSALMAATATPSVYYVTVNPTTQAVTARQDLSANFGVPFADVHKLFTGSASSDGRDDYTISVSAATEVIFTRGYSDNKTEGKYVRFNMDTGVVTSVDNAQWAASGIAVTSEVECIEMYREGSSLIAMLRDNTRLIFSDVPLAPYTPGTVPAILYRVPAVIGCAYTSRAQLLRPDSGQDAGAPAGPAFGKRRRIHWYGAYLLRTRVISYGTNFTSRMHPAKLGSEGGTPIGNTALFSGIISSTIADNHRWESQIAWQQTRPTPGTILAISGYLEVQEK